MGWVTFLISKSMMKSPSGNNTVEFMGWFSCLWYLPWQLVLAHILESCVCGRQGNGCPPAWCYLPTFCTVTVLRLLSWITPCKNWQWMFLQPSLAQSLKIPTSKQLGGFPWGDVLSHWERAAVATRSPSPPCFSEQLRASLLTDTGISFNEVFSTPARACRALAF